MSVSILNRPYGYNIATTGVAIDEAFDDSGHVTFRVNGGHGLTNGQAVYIKTNIEDYNGFYTAFVGASTTFAPNTISTSPEIVPFVNDITEGTFYEVENTHYWNCVHLPIVYELTNTLWPTNSVDTVRTMSSVTDSSGYCALSLSGDIKSTGSAAALEFVKITGSTDDDLNGVWQIISYTNDTTFVINIPYSSANDTALTGASIQYYYNNYNVKIEVWGGLNNGHVYYAQEPYELLATLEIVPDDDNYIKVSINEILKKNVAIKNNLLQSTLPNNLDAFTLFFIKYGESYDDSDGSTLTQTTPSYTSDLSTFEGKAVNAILPFKNVHSGALSEYQLGISPNSGNRLPGKFLTNAEEPVIFDGQYFDLSFLWDGAQTVVYKLQYYLNNVLQSTVYSEPMDAFYIGVYRSQIESNCSYDRVDVTAYKCSRYSIPAPNALTSGLTARWSELGIFPFTKTSTEFQQAPAENNSEVILAVNTEDLFHVYTGDIVLMYGISIETSGLAGAVVSFILTNETGSSDVGQDSTSITTDGVHTDDWQITASGERQYYRMFLAGVSGVGTIDIDLPDYAYVVAAQAISETKTILIDCDCLPSKATGYNMSWINNLGGFDYWYFNTYSEHIVDVTESEETEENIFPEWPNSYGEFADTQRKETYRKSRKQVVCRSQGLTIDQVNCVKLMKSSPLVQIVNSIYDRRTVILDRDSFTAYKEGQLEQYTVGFTMTFTDDIPSQTI